MSKVAMSSSESLHLDPSEFNAELSAIAQWWLDHAMDRDRGGVYGEIADDNTVRKDADKSAILHCRVLWFLSKFARLRKDAAAQQAARTLYDYIVDTFCDDDEGGLVWSVSADGAWRADRKQVYAQAFAIYAFSAYAAAFDDDCAMTRAVNLANLLEGRAYDNEKGGYIEAFARDWLPIDDWRLSERDLNAPKTMNTHLHVLEAYTELHKLLHNEFTRALLKKNVDLFTERFVRPDGEGLFLFYAMDWRSLSDDDSYGHNIEASWLLSEAAQSLKDAARIDAAKTIAVSLADATLKKAVDRQGGLIYEWFTGASEPVRERHWWPQAEALVGFYNAFELMGEARHRDAAARVWAFIKSWQIDRTHGEWLWLSAADAPRRGPCKAGFWKGPYHNGRAMMEMMMRLRRANEQ